MRVVSGSWSGGSGSGKSDPWERLATFRPNGRERASSWHEKLRLETAGELTPTRHLLPEVPARPLCFNKH